MPCRWCSDASRRIVAADFGCSRGRTCSCSLLWASAGRRRPTHPWPARTHPDTSRQALEAPGVGSSCTSEWGFARLGSACKLASGVQSALRAPTLAHSRAVSRARWHAQRGKRKKIEKIGRRALAALVRSSTPPHTRSSTQSLIRTPYSQRHLRTPRSRRGRSTLATVSAPSPRRLYVTFA